MEGGQAAQFQLEGQRSLHVPHLRERDRGRGGEKGRKRGREEEGEEEREEERERKRERGREREEERGREREEERGRDNEKKARAWFRCSEVRLCVNAFCLS